MNYPTFPGTVYLDTSYLVSLLIYPKNPKDSHLLKCKRLHDHLLGKKTRLIGSLFTLEETIYLLFFKHVLGSEARKHKFKNPKEFRRSRPKQYHKTYMANTTLVTWIVSQAESLSVEFRHPRYINPLLETTGRIRQYAASLLRKYSELDSKDAFHVALARCMNIDMLVACDRDFSSVTEIGFFNPLA